LTANIANTYLKPFSSIDISPSILQCEALTSVIKQGPPTSIGVLQKQ